jgi:hypothetical protein
MSVILNDYTLLSFNKVISSGSAISGSFKIDGQEYKYNTILSIEGEPIDDFVSNYIYNSGLNFADFAPLLDTLPDDISIPDTLSGYTKEDIQNYLGLSVLKVNKDLFLKSNTIQWNTAALSTESKDLPERRKKKEEPVVESADITLETLKDITIELPIDEKVELTEGDEELDANFNNTDDLNEKLDLLVDDFEDDIDSKDGSKSVNGNYIDVSYKLFSYTGKLPIVQKLFNIGIKPDGHTYDYSSNKTGLLRELLPTHIADNIGEYKIKVINLEKPEDFENLKLSDKEIAEYNEYLNNSQVDFQYYWIGVLVNNTSKADEVRFLVDDSGNITKDSSGLRHFILLNKKDLSNTSLNNEHRPAMQGLDIKPDGTLAKAIKYLKYIFSNSMYGDRYQVDTREKTVLSYETQIINKVKSGSFYFDIHSVTNGILPRTAKSENKTVLTTDKVRLNVDSRNKVRPGKFYYIGDNVEYALSLPSLSEIKGEFNNNKFGKPEEPTVEYNFLSMLYNTDSELYKNGDGLNITNSNVLTLLKNHLNIGYFLYSPIPNHYRILEKTPELISKLNDYKNNIISPDELKSHINSLTIDVRDFLNSKINLLNDDSPFDDIIKSLIKTNIAKIKLPDGSSKHYKIARRLILVTDITPDGLLGENAIKSTSDDLETSESLPSEEETPTASDLQSEDEINKERNKKLVAKRPNVLTLDENGDLIEATSSGAKTGIDFSGAFAFGISATYQQIFDALEKSTDIIAGLKSREVNKLKPLYDRGLIKSKVDVYHRLNEPTINDEYDAKIQSLLSKEQISSTSVKKGVLELFESDLDINTKAEKSIFNELIKVKNITKEQAIVLAKQIQQIKQKIAKKLGIPLEKYEERLRLKTIFGTINEGVENLIHGKDMDSSWLFDTTDSVNETEVLYQSEEQKNQILQAVPSLNAEADKVLIRALGENAEFIRSIKYEVGTINQELRAELNKAQKELQELFKNKQGQSERGQELQETIKQLKDNVSKEEGNKKITTFTREQAVEFIKTELDDIDNRIRNTNEFYIDDYTDAYIDNQINFERTKAEPNEAEAQK